MTNLLFGLVLGILVTAGIFVLNRRGGGGLFCFSTAARLERERIRIEDALKHLFQSSYDGRNATVQSTAGALDVKVDEAARILETLENRGLAAPTGSFGFELTEAGNKYALQIVRVHRLWEEYYSRRTGLPESDWHQLAHQQEHMTSPEQADQMDASLGHPRFDPHGDPIPTADGEIAASSARPLSSFHPGETGIIRHLEDEPVSVYQRITAARLAPGLKIEMIEMRDGVIRFRSETGEYQLDHAAAENVSLDPLDIPADSIAGFTLSDLSPGDGGVIRSISPLCRGIERRRLFDLGFLPGTPVEAEMRGTFGDPTGYRIRGTLIALRKEQASLVAIQRTNGKGGRSREART